MSISSNTRKAGPYSCNGVTVAFPFSFKVFQASDVRVVLTDSSGAEVDLALGAAYSVSLNSNQDANPGGTVTTAATYAVGYLVTLTSQVKNLQPVTLTNAGGFYPKVINDALDRLTIMVQQVAEQVSRSVKVSISSSTSLDSLISAIYGAAGYAANAAASASSAAASAVAAAASAASISVTNLLQRANNLSDLTSAATARSNLGLGTAALSNTGTSAGNVVQLDGSARLPPVDGGQLSGVIVGDGSITAKKISGGTGSGALTQYTATVSALPSAGSSISVSHSLGVAPIEAVLEITCLSADAGFPAGAVISSPFQWNGSYYDPIQLWSNQTTVNFKLISGFSIAATNPSTDAFNILTAAKWSYRFRLRAA